jgi:hypothetical protein
MKDQIEIKTIKIKKKKRNRPRHALGATFEPKPI